jgi:E3 ubiquitin-protein ligase HUWE1
VVETKAALARATALPDGDVKHAQIQSITSLIQTMIDSCPSQGQPHPDYPGMRPPGVNNVSRLLWKKGLLVDLAKIPHSLNLSSASLAQTVNVVLRPLDTLTRSINLPASGLGSASDGGGSSSVARSRETGDRTRHDARSQRWGTANDGGTDRGGYQALRPNFDRIRQAAGEL